jgi:hypothetical protein
VSNGSESEGILEEALRKHQRYTGKVLDGEASKLEDAFREAYEKGASDGHRLFRVEEIFVVGDNPLSGYGVVISPTG